MHPPELVKRKQAERRPIPWQRMEVPQSETEVNETTTSGAATESTCLAAPLPIDNPRVESRGSQQASNPVT